ncbi:helix-turn-helix domain protein [Ruminiclostridium papyrosolvens DSM 2782]|uniref:Helix-turn-helix domain protein n=1 Tax=Ruminiclostridium papyrosolvens DSM 2782 TaxID=588581 RepID=F1THF9_9FIRM|nr:helix-turn-helix domain protein [Ruminiclostridium papyrosolvens DSM 2782]
MEKKLDLKGIGLRIRSEREKIGLTREQFAEQVGISPLYVGQIERGQRAMSLKTFVKIADSLHANTDFLIYGIEERASGTDKDGVLNLLEKCSVRELKLAEEMLKLLLTYIK